MEKSRHPLILASASAARQAVLRQAGLAFSAQPAELDEAAVKCGFEGTAQALALTLARLKAAAVSACHPGALVIGADQLRVSEGRYFDKPVGLAGAAAQLRALRGRRHELVTAICVVQDGATMWEHVAVPALTMRAVSDGFIENYLAAEGEALCHCVGAYRLEGLGVQLFAQIEGDYFTILGLPLLALLDFLRRCGALAV